MSTHNICFHEKLEKIILELSSNTPPYQVSCSTRKEFGPIVRKFFRFTISNKPFQKEGNTILTAPSRHTTLKQRRFNVDSTS